MSKELIVSTGKHETRVAILEDDQLVEIFHEREKEYSLAGSIHKGRVTRVLPGMQSAFVDIGLERDAFLYVSDFFEDNEEYDAVVSTVEEKVLKMESRGSAAPVSVPVLSEAPPAIEAAAPEAVMAAGSAFLAPAPEARTERPNRGNDRGGGDRPSGDRGGGDQGGRGRRGRRRRGGRGGNGGIPESKFYSPRNDADNTVQARGATEPEIEDAEPQPVVINRQSDDDFMVLPGESLAKYADAEPAIEAEPEAESEPEIGSFAAWATPGPKAVEIVPEVVEVAEEPLAAAIEAHQEAAIDEVSDPGPIEFIDEPEEEPVGQVPDLPIPEPAVAAEEKEEEEVSAFEEESASSEDEPLFSSEEEPVSASAEEPVPVDEGPEPARIPTSLTAALREQGHRYPHRVSRRMRRKMRGGPGEDREKPAGQAEGEIAEPKPAEVKVVAPQQRDERPPQHERGGRDRNRGDRPERSERPEQRSEQRSERPEQRSERSEQRPERVERERPVLPSISDLLKEGQEIIVQIAKEPLGQKGARITSHIALPGRFVVYMPTVDHVGVSRKIPSDEERQRLKRILQTHRQGIPGGFICRTAAENKSEEELKSDMHFLYNLWLDMRQKAEKKPAPVLLHHDLDLVQRILRDQLTTSFKNHLGG